MRQKQFIAMFWQTVKEMLFWVNDEWQVAELLVALEAEDFFFFLNYEFIPVSLLFLF